MAMRASVDAEPERKRINVFKVDKLWLFKHFSTTGTFSKLCWTTIILNQYRFEFKSTGARNNALKLLERNGLDYDLVEDLKGYVVKLPKFAKYAQILKNSVASKETANERLFLMKDLVAAEEAVSLGAKIVEGEVAF
jgi:hypothetical protein